MTDIEVEKRRRRGPKGPIGPSTAIAVGAGLVVGAGLILYFAWAPLHQPLWTWRWFSMVTGDGWFNALPVGNHCLGPPNEIFTPAIPTARSSSAMETRASDSRASTHLGLSRTTGTHSSDSIRLKPYSTC